MAKALRKEFGAGIVSFGAEVRRVAAEQGLDTSDRRLLQKVGQELVETDLIGFCRRVIDQEDVPDATLLVIDGLRHDSVREALSALILPRTLTVALLKASPSTVAARLKADDISGGLLAEVQSDATEVEVDTRLHRWADVILSAEDSTARNARAIMAFINDRQRSGGPESSEPYARRVLDVLGGEGLLLADQVRERAGLTAPQMNRLVRARRLLLVTVGGDTPLIPAFQFDSTGVRPEVADAVEALTAEGDMSPWEVAAWFLAPNGALDGDVPVDAGEDSLPHAVESELHPAF